MERLSDLDAAFLAGDTGSQHLHVLATLVLDPAGVPGGMDYRIFEQRIRERFHLIPALRRRLQPVPLGRPVWVDDPDIRLERHLRHAVLPPGSDLDALAALAGDIASEPLPKDRPLWEVWFVEGLASGEVAVVAKVHHCAIDGVSGIWALAAFFDLEPFPDASSATTAWDAEPAPTPSELARGVLDDLRERPATVLRSLRRVVASAATLAGEHGEETPFPFRSPRPSFNRALSGRRSVAFTDIPLSAVKDVRRGFGVTINDVVTALVAGGLRSYLERRDELPDVPLVAGVPVSERAAEHGLGGNRLSFMFYALPVHLADPVERLLAVRRSADAAKDVYGKAGVGLFADLASLVPPVALAPAMRVASRLRIADAVPPAVNVIVSNVRGPEFPLYVSGSRLTQMFPMGPLMEGVGLGVTVVSYREDVGFGFIACPDLVPDVREIADLVHTELAVLADRAAVVLD